MLGIERLLGGDVGVGRKALRPFLQPAREEVVGIAQDQREPYPCPLRPRPLEEGQKRRRQQALGAHVLVAQDRARRGSRPQPVFRHPSGAGRPVGIDVVVEGGSAPDLAQDPADREMVARAAHPGDHEDLVAGAGPRQPFGEPQTQRVERAPRLPQRGVQGRPLPDRLAEAAVHSDRSFRRAGSPSPSRRPLSNGLESAPAMCHARHDACFPEGQFPAMSALSSPGRPVGPARCSACPAPRPA